MLAAWWIPAEEALWKLENYLNFLAVRRRNRLAQFGHGSTRRAG